LFEEAGGDPSQVRFQTIAVGTICGTVFERKTLNLTCQGAGKISKIEFASFGNPQGTCQAFKKGNCESPDAMDKITKVTFMLNLDTPIYDQYIICVLFIFRNVLDKHHARLLQMKACSVPAVHVEMLSRNSQCKQCVVSVSFESQ